MRLEPILQAQEEAAPYDIHLYADHVLQDLGAITAHRRSLGGPKTKDMDKISFKKIVAGRDSAEVCRVFLACLQLANHGNVQVNASAPGMPPVAKGGYEEPVVVSDFSLELVSQVRRRDVEEFLAPSMMHRLPVYQDDEVASANMPTMMKKKSVEGSGKGKKKLQVDRMDENAPLPAAPLTVGGRGRGKRG
jgi:hypothetical protein